MNEPHTSPRTRRRVTGLIAAAFLAGIVVTAVALLVFGPDGEQPAPAARPPAPAPAPTDEAPSGDQALPLEGPPVRWEQVGGVAVPVSAEAGPHSLNGPMAEDFQRSPVGALIAAVQIDTRHLLTAGDGWRQVTDRQVLPGPGRDRYIQARASVDDPTVDPSQLAQIAGFRFVNYSPDHAVIQLATQQPDGLLIGTTVTVRWSGGDWRLELQPNGASSPPAQQLTDLRYYTPWSGR